MEGLNVLIRSQHKPFLPLQTNSEDFGPRLLNGLVYLSFFVLPRV